MAKIAEQARKQYSEYIAPHKNSIAELNAKEKRIELEISQDKANESYKRLDLAKDNLRAVSLYMVINSLSLIHLGIKNEKALDNARKTCYKAIIQLEKVFTNLMDVPYSDYEEALLATSDFPEMKRYELIRKTGLSIALIQDAFGEKSKWKWFFVDLQARLATIAKNTLNLKMLNKGLDPRVQSFQKRNDFFNLTRKLLENSAEAYRLKYEIVTSHVNDFRKAISYLSQLKRLCLILNLNNEVSTLKKKIDVWTTKMEQDYRHKEALARSRQRSKGHL